MKVSSRILMGALLWTGMISGLHMWLNVNWSEVVNDR